MISRSKTKNWKPTMIKQIKIYFDSLPPKTNSAMSIE